MKLVEINVNINGKPLRLDWRRFCIWLIVVLIAVDVIVLCLPFRSYAVAA